MTGENFYLAASGLIPVLLLADTFVKQTNYIVNRAEVVDRLNAIAPRLTLIGGTIWLALYAWAEFACLKALATDRPPPGGQLPVWLALAALGVQSAYALMLPRIADAFPHRVEVVLEGDVRTPPDANAAQAATSR